MNGLDRFLLFVALPTVLAASLLEALVLARLRHYDWGAAGVSVLDLFARIALQILGPVSIATPLILLVHQHPLVIEFHEWGRLARDLAAARSLRAVFGRLLMPPGWRADGATSTTAELRARAALPLLHATPLHGGALAGNASPAILPPANIDALAVVQVAR